VNCILNAMLNVSSGREVKLWTTDGGFVDTETARQNHLKVAAANWHATATLAGQYVPHGAAILVDVGSTTTDVIPILDGLPVPEGRTDPERLSSGELVYTGVRRSPICAILGSTVAAELFATSYDAYLLLGKLASNPANCDTADGRPATVEFAHARMSRMVGGDSEMVTVERATSLADDVMCRQLVWIEFAIKRVADRLEGLGRKLGRSTSVSFVFAGSGEFLAHELVARGFMLGIHRVAVDEVRSLTETLGPDVSACAAAYAVAVLATEQRPKVAPPTIWPPWKRSS
jgi:probable H4MPT-linked C1 transfer pathway protein